ncbi:MAG: hypothetical protein ACHQIO_14900 [Nevskiales bacterium]
MTLHPASLLLGWLSLALALQWLSLPALATVAGLILPAALWYSRPRFLLLLRRARWLLLSIALLFALATPGEALPGLAGTLGLSDAGCALAAAHALRLTLLLALLALLLDHLGIPALISGLYLLLAPFGEMRARARIALRLMLVLEYVEENRQVKGQRHWQDWFNPLPPVAEYAPIELKVAPLHGGDYALMMLALAGLAGMLWWSLYSA